MPKAAPGAGGRIGAVTWVLLGAGGVLGGSVCQLQRAVAGDNANGGCLGVAEGRLSFRFLPLLSSRTSGLVL